MPAFDLAELRADTASIIGDWEEAVSFLRPTNSVISGAGGAVTHAWSTNLTTGCDVQPLNPRTRDYKTIGGEDYRPDVQVFAPHGSDIDIGDRFTFNSRVHTVRAVRPDEEKVVAFATADKDQRT